MKKTILTFSLLLVFLPAFSDDISQNLNKMNAAKLLVESGSKNYLEVSDVLKESAKNALGIMQTVELQKDAENFERTYYAVLAKANLILQNFDEVISLYSKAEESGEAALSEELEYFTATAYFQKKNTEEVKKLLGEEKSETESRVFFQKKNLLASVFYVEGKYAEACKIYESLKDKNKLDEKGILDYSKALYKLGKYSEASALLENEKSEEAVKIRAACLLSQKKFAEASDLYSKISVTPETLFNKAYSEYKAGKYGAAAKDFKEAGEYNLAAKSYLLAGNLAEAEAAAEKNLNAVKGEEETGKAVLFLADIYADGKKNEKAYSLLKKYAGLNKSYSAKCLYKLAGFYASAGNIEQASETFGEVYKKYPVYENAEEALFKSGELLYLNGKYASAAPKLKVYGETFKKGIYINTAMYYEFEALVQSGEKIKAIQTGNKIVTQYEDSEFLNTVLEKLYSIHYEREDYAAACSVAQKLADRTGHTDEALERKISYMKQILAGGNKELIIAEADFEAAGGKATIEGREKGTALAGLYARDSEIKSKAVKLAGELLALQEKDIVNEREGAAVNALILADYFYEQNRKAEAAEKYLKAAEYSRMNGDNDKAAFSLYTATECFVHIGKRGDANETAALLKQLYPDSKYTSAVRSLLK